MFALLKYGVEHDMLKRKHLDVAPLNMTSSSPTITFKCNFKNYKISQQMCSGAKCFGGYFTISSSLTAISGHLLRLTYSNELYTYWGTNLFLDWISGKGKLTPWVKHSKTKMHTPKKKCSSGSSSRPARWVWGAKALGGWAVWRCVRRPSTQPGGEGSSPCCRRCWSRPRFVAASPPPRCRRRKGIGQFRIWANRTDEHTVS